MAYTILSKVVGEIKNCVSVFFHQTVWWVLILCQILIYMRYTKSEDKGTNFVLLIIGNYGYKRYEEHNVQWESWCGCCALEAVSVFWHSSRFRVWIKTVAQNGAGTNYVIHWQALAVSNKISSYLKQIISTVSL
jgi:hypothetical protein